MRLHDVTDGAADAIADAVGNSVANADTVVDAIADAIADAVASAVVDAVPVWIENAWAHTVSVVYTHAPHPASRIHTHPLARQSCWIHFGAVEVPFVVEIAICESEDVVAQQGWGPRACAAHLTGPASSTVVVVDTAVHHTSAHFPKELVVYFPLLLERLPHTPVRGIQEHGR
jgi:hypothetical protein